MKMNMLAIIDNNPKNVNGNNPWFDKFVITKPIKFSLKLLNWLLDPGKWTLMNMLNWYA